MKSSESYPSLLNCSFVSESEYRERILQALEKDTLTHIVTLNAEMIVEAQTNLEFRDAVHKAELKIPDGGSLLWAKEYLGNKRPTDRSGGGSAMRLILSLIKFFFSKQQPLTGIDSVFTICEAVERKNGTVYLLGGTDAEAQGTADVLQKKYPRLHVTLSRTSPNPSFERRGNSTTRRKPLPLTKGELEGVRVIFVALGSPKQTLYIEQHRKILEASGVKIAIGVGGAFTIISGILPRAPMLMRKHHLEWLWRLILEPNRIRRIWNAVIIFPYRIRGYPH